jgi:hypothetical protein
MKKTTIKSLKLKRTESPIVTACCDYLAAKRYFFWRQNNTPIFDPRDGRKFFRRHPKHSKKGVPDIFVLKKSELFALASKSRRDPIRDFNEIIIPVIYAIEVKTLVGRQSKEQKEFQQGWEAQGGIYLIIRSVDDLMRVGF